MPRVDNIKVRRGAKETWTSTNPVLDTGEFGFDTTDNLVKIGNGTDNWQNLSILALANPIILASGSSFTSKITIRSPIVNFKSIADTNIFTVPSGHMFFIDTMEIVTTSITTPGVAPTIRFGNSISNSEYYSATQINSNSLGARHIIEIPQDGIPSGIILTFGITVASTASAHQGCSVISGYLLKTS